MGRALDYDEARKLLETIFGDAEKDSQNKKKPAVPKVIEAAAETLFGSNTQAFREALIGCLLAKLQEPGIDIKQPYMNLGDDAFNGRTLDERVVNPFLQENEIPCSKGPYLSALRRSVSFEPETQKGVRDKDAFGAMLAFIAQVEASKPNEIEDYLRYLLGGFIELREKSNIALAKINRLSMDQYETLVGSLLATQSGGLMPVLLAVAAFQAMKDVYNLPWQIDSQGINVADAASGAGGDVTISRDGKTILALEITERNVDVDRVQSTFRTKILPNKLDDYVFIISGGKPTDDAVARARTYFAQGHEVSFIPLRPWIMTLLPTLGSAGRAVFTDTVIASLDKKEVPAALKVAWNEIVRKLV